MKNPIVKNIFNKIIKQDKAYALFDFDNTLIKGDLGESFLHYLATNYLWKINNDFLCSFQSDKLKIKKIILEPETEKKNKIDSTHPLLKYLEEINFKSNSILNTENPTHKKIVQLILSEYLQILYLYGPQIAYPWSAVLFSGFTLSEFKKIARKLILDERYKNIQSDDSFGMTLEFGFRVQKEMLNLIKQLHKKSIPVIIVSASPLELIQVFFEIHPEFGINANDIIAMDIIKQGQNKTFSTQINNPMTYGEGKVQAFKNKYPAKKILFASGDSITDFAMLEAANFSLFIDKGNSEYLKIAKKKNWSIVKQSDL